MTRSSMTPSQSDKKIDGCLLSLLTGVFLPCVFFGYQYEQSEEHHKENINLQHEFHDQDMKREERIDQERRLQEEADRIPDIQLTRYGTNEGVTLVELTNLSRTATAEITQTKFIVSHPYLVQKIKNTRLRPNLDLRVHDVHEELQICLKEPRWESNPESYVCVRNKAFSIPPGGKVELRICNHDLRTYRMDLHGEIEFSANQLRTFRFDGFRIGPNTKY